MKKIKCVKCGKEYEEVIKKFSKKCSDCFFECRCPEELQKLEEKAGLFHLTPIECAEEKEDVKRRKEEALKLYK